MIMASTPESIRIIHKADNENGSGYAASYFQKTVCLYDWWLVRAENDFNGKRLAVAGLTSRPEEPVRIFSSAPILKRFDIFTLETADGICVVLKGYLNKRRTNDNGFSSEVFKHFVFGFPHDWETHATNAFEDVAYNCATTGNISDTVELLSKSENSGVDECTPTIKNSPGSKISPSKEGDEKLNVTPSNIGSKYSGRLRNLKNNQRSPLCKNLDAQWKKQKVITSESNTERSKIKSATDCSDYVTNIAQDGTSNPGCEITNMCDEQLSLSMHGSLVNEQDGSVEYGSPLENDARQGLNLGDDVVQDVMESMNATGNAESFTGLVGSHHKTGVDIKDEETDIKRKEDKSSRKKVKRNILFSSPGSSVTRQGKKTGSIISPECLSYGRSRSGRLLLPTMEFWRNQLPVYDADRKIKGIQEGLPMKESPGGSKSEPRRKP